MILGIIVPYKTYQHIETSRLCEVQRTDVQIKLHEPNFGSNQWFTGVIYEPSDKPGEWFVTDVDSFRRKFKEVEA